MGYDAGASGMGLFEAGSRNRVIGAELVYYWLLKAPAFRPVSFVHHKVLG